ncbi:MAG TPA: hypothetical protein VKQ29_01395 [Aliidongia sp.]|nr:hypothetical protein [Aliidongia sp.]
MIPSQSGAPTDTLDARWIISLWIALHGGRDIAESGGELVLERHAVRAAAAHAILALAAELDAKTGDAIGNALGVKPGPAEVRSDAQLEDALKRLGVRVYQPGKPGDSGLTGMSVAGFGKICWG